MIIHAEGKLTRVVTYVEIDGKREPALAIYRPAVRGKMAMIPLSCAFKYDEPKTAEEKATVFEAVRRIATALDYPVTGPSLARIAMCIQDGLDDLIKAPVPPARKKQIIGEAAANINGVKHHFEVKVKA